MTELLQIGILPLVLTLGAYQVGLLCQKKLKTPLCNPVLVAVVLVLGVLALTGIEVGDYQAGTSYISWLLTPATVCLAIPMYQQLQVLRKNMSAILAGIAAGAVSSLVMILAVCAVLKLDPVLTVSLLPKSVTTAIGAPLSEMNGGLSPVTTTVIILTGIFASCIGSSLAKLLRITDEVAQGVAFGTAGHVIGTSRANAISPLTGAVSSLSLVVAGLLTAIFFPLAVSWI